MTENDRESDIDRVLGRFSHQVLAKTAIGVGGVSAASLAVPITAITRTANRSDQGSLYADGTYLLDADGNRVAGDALKNGERMTVFPESHTSASDAPTLLVRVLESEYTAPKKRPFTVSGYAAY